MLVFEEYPEKTSRFRVANQQTHPTYEAEAGAELNPGHIGGRRVLSPMHHLCTPKKAPLELAMKRARVNCLESSSALSE